MTQPKFSKAEIQKIALSGIGFIALIYVYLNFFLAPLAKSREATEKTIAEVRAKIDASQTEIPKATNLERLASTATARYSMLQGLAPEGAPIAWFPPRMKLFFANQHIEKIGVKLDTSGAFTQKELGEWARYVWQLDLPTSDFATVGKAIAELENTEPLLNISRVSIHAGTDNPEFQQVALTASTAFFKR
ncbi:MAG: hypothetical protein M3032_09220 [Verrucomicrobiota bacterium]|nr:hypothetical protein [Verrucomicrobiota bacterium]